MFRQVRYQTGEIEDIVREMRNGSIPCLDVDNKDELEWFLGELTGRNIFRAEDVPYDNKARDRVREPDFEYRIAFSEEPGKISNAGNSKLMYLDVYFEPEMEETYDGIGEI